MSAIPLPFRRALMLGGCLVACFCGGTLASAAAAEKPAAASPAKPKMATDAVLRQGMEDIADSLGSRREAIEQNRLASADYLALADRTDARLAAIVKNCKLDPKADAAFHAILADMNHAVELMRGRKVELQRAGALALGQALQNYATYFEHPGWAWSPAQPK